MVHTQLHVSSLPVILEKLVSFSGIYIILLGLTAEYPATSKINPQIGWIRGYADTKIPG